MVERDRIAEFKEVAELMPDGPVVRFGLAGGYRCLPRPRARATPRISTQCYTDGDKNSASKRRQPGGRSAEPEGADYRKA